VLNTGEGILAIAALDSLARFANALSFQHSTGSPDGPVFVRGRVVGVAGAIAGPTGIRHCLCVSYMYTCKGVVASRLRHGTVQLNDSKKNDDNDKPRWGCCCASRQYRGWELRLDVVWGGEMGLGCWRLGVDCVSVVASRVDASNRGKW
jgi:hypothetical protein